MTVTQENAQWFADTFSKIVDNVGQALLGKEDVIRLALTCMLAEGHLLLEFEDGVSAAASLARATMSEAKEVSIVTQMGKLKTPTIMHALDALALDALSSVETVFAAERLPELTHKAGKEVPGASVAVVITGAKAAPSDMHAALVHLPLNMLVAAVRFDVSQPLDLRTIAGA